MLVLSFTLDPDKVPRCYITHRSGDPLVLSFMLYQNGKRPAIRVGFEDQPCNFRIGRDDRDPRVGQVFSPERAALPVLCPCCRQPLRPFAPGGSPEPPDL
jgi:hypothetical protein